MELNEESKIDSTSLGVLEWMNQFSDALVEQMNDKNESQPVKLSDNTGTSLLDLNDYCLLDIMSMRSVDLLDLCSLAKTCERFQQLTNRVISKRFVIITRPDKDESGYAYSDGWTWPFRPRKLKEVRRIFKQFGSVFSHVRLCGDTKNIHNYSFMLDVVAKYCVGDVLKKLFIKQQNICENLTEKLRPIFKPLRSIYLDNVTISDPTLFTGLDSLVELDVHFGENCSAVLENVFPKLQTFDYMCLGVTNDTVGPESLETLVTFVSRHKILRDLKIYFLLCGDICKNAIIQAIINNCKELEQLSIKMDTFFIESIRPLQSLKMLKELTLMDVNCDNFEDFPAMKELRFLHLLCCRIPSDVKQFVHLNHLTSLSMVWFTNRTVDVVGIVKLLKDLKFSELRDDDRRFCLDESKYLKIVDITKTRNHVLTLSCKFDFKLTKSVEKLKVRLQYEEHT